MLAPLHSLPVTVVNRIAFPPGRAWGSTWRSFFERSEAIRDGDLPRDRQGLVRRKRALGDSVGKGRALDELHHERLHASGIFEPVESRDVRMIERGEDFSLALETGEPVWICRHPGRQDLDRDLTLQPRVGRAIHLAHSALAERRDDAVRSQAGSLGQGHPTSIL